MPLVKAAIIVLFGTLAVAATAPRTVWVGLEGPDLDACPSLGEVSGLNPAGDNFLSVRAGPGTDAREIGRLGQGHWVHLCDATPDGAWLGIVYGRTPEEDCGVGSPVAAPQAYRGACASGWVSERYITVIAG